MTKGFDYTDPSFLRKVVVGYMLIIYSTLSVLRPITTYLREQNILRVTCGLIVVIVSGLIIYVLWRQLKAAPLLLLRNTLLLALLFAPVALWLKLPEERMHLVEYSLLTPLLILALRDKLQGTRLFLVVFAIGTLLSTIDEGIQYLLPNRYGEWGDVGLNVTSVILGFAIYFGLRGTLPTAGNY